MFFVHSINMRHLYSTCRYHSTATYFITTPIFYVNAAPHLGHLYTAVIADAAHRFQQLLYPYTPTLFSTGTDEHGQKVQKAAGSINPDEVKLYCDNIASKYQMLFDSCGISYSKFIRTTDLDHHTSVQTLWNLLESNGHIYKGEHAGWYCIPDETFLTDKQLKDVENRDGKVVKVSESSGHPVEWTCEENYIFRLSSFRSDLRKWINDKTRVTPSKFHQILQSWIFDDSSMNDISVSRPKSRIPWGIPVPSSTDQNVYVWLDALVSYLTVAQFPDIKTWPPSVHVVGKDILKFHGIYWPAFLIAAGLEPPQKLFVHSHWTVDGEKMSKSKNNVVDPVAAIRTYTVSGFRYFLLKEGVPHSDSNFTESKVVNMLNADLANTFGNLLNRSVSKTVNYKQIFPKLYDAEYQKLYSESETLKAHSQSFDILCEEITKHYLEFNFYKGIRLVLDALYLSNKFFDEQKPWELSREEIHGDKLSCILHITMESLRISAIALQPIIPDVSEEVFSKLNVDVKYRKWEAIKPSWTLGSQSYNTIDMNLNNKKVILFNKLKS